VASALLALASAGILLRRRVPRLRIDSGAGVGGKIRRVQNQRMVEHDIHDSAAREFCLRSARGEHGNQCADASHPAPDQRTATGRVIDHASSDGADVCAASGGQEDRRGIAQGAGTAL